MVLEAEPSVSPGRTLATKAGPAQRRGEQDHSPSLYTLVHPRRTVFFLIKRNRESLSAAVVLGLDDGDIEAVWVHRELLGARHA